MTQLAIPAHPNRFNPTENPNPVVADAREEYGTPWNLFNPLHQEFGFELDVCAKDWNAKLPNYLTPEQNGLTSPWNARTAWCNPPYGSENITYWLQKALDERDNGTTTVLLLPSTTDVQWYHKFLYDAQKHTFRPGIQVRFVNGRVKFIIPPPIAAQMRRQGKTGASGAHTGSILVVISPIKDARNFCLRCQRPL